MTQNILRNNWQGPAKEAVWLGSLWQQEGGWNGALAKMRVWSL